MITSLLKHVLPDKSVPVRIRRGPFRGARIVMNPRSSMRKILGLYEHELNSWLNAVLPKVKRIVDVGANDGYFTLGCAAAFRRLGIDGEIMGVEPQDQHMETLKASVNGAGRITLVQALVGRDEAPGMMTLDNVRWTLGAADARSGALIKIDVEGAEIDVLAGAGSWMTPGNYFMIEVHERSFLDEIPKMFAARGLRLKRIDQKPLPILGREVRSPDNWWLVTDLDRPRF